MDQRLKQKLKNWPHQECINDMVALYTQHQHSGGGVGLEIQGHTPASNRTTKVPRKVIEEMRKA